MTNAMTSCLIMAFLLPGFLLGQFGPAVSLTGDSVQAMQWGDWNSDGRPDLVFAAVNANSEVELCIFTATADTIAQSHVLPFTYAEVYSLQWDDADNDGDIDLMVFGRRANETGFYLWINGPEGFEELPVEIISLEPLAFPTGLYATWGDVNG
ncbi:MAG: FG-GAP-like repeat-containing protein, partial [Candidatus Cloacimonadaceae bacterium]|nr:FG-GAP-like repeat-containing protein [Candidatus Cloacimonadaceae bacterium]